ncbi:MAG: hypothetical protein IJK62_07895 [Bacteroidales bacterium]|nr:hypothetical protein [Bacteroidales bacterium]
MVWIILCAISYIGIFVMFKIIDVKKAPLINCIVVNYLTAAVLGFCVFGSLPVVSIVKASWFPMGILLGFLFIVTFLLVGISSSKTGIVITTVASKMSLVIPMLFSIIAYNETVSVVKVVAIALAVASVFLCTYKPSGSKAKSDVWKFLLPAIIFVAMGANDSLVIYSREKFGIYDDAALFTATLFAISLLCGIIYSIVKECTLRNFLKFKVWLFGILLGSFNFGSVYFVIRSMNTGLITTSSLYGICNTSTILLSILIGVMFFKEKLTKLNIIGGVCALATIVLMAYAGM